MRPACSGPGSAEGEQHEIAQVVPAHGGDRLDRFFHLHVDDAHNAFSRIVDGKPERACHSLLSIGGARLVAIEPHLPAEEVVFAKIAQHEVAVGDGGRLAAAPVACRSRYCARAVRPDLERTEPVDCRDGAAPGAHRVDVEHRYGEIAAFDFSAARQQRLAVLDQRDVAGSSTHVEGDDVAKPLMRQASAPAVTPPAGPDNTVVTARRAAAAKVAMPPFDCMTYFCRVAIPAPTRRRSSSRDIARKDRLQVGVDDRRAQSVIFADLRQHLRRQRDAAVRHFLEHDLAHARFMRGMKKREQQAHRDRIRYSLSGARVQSRAARLRRAARSTLPRKSTRSFTSPVRLGGTRGAGLSYMTSKIACRRAAPARRRDRCRKILRSPASRS